MLIKTVSMSAPCRPVTLRCGRQVPDPSDWRMMLLRLRDQKKGRAPIERAYTWLVRCYAVRRLTVRCVVERYVSPRGCWLFNQSATSSMSSKP